MHSRIPIVAGVTEIFSNGSSSTGGGVNSQISNSDQGFEYRGGFFFVNLVMKVALLHIVIKFKELNRLQFPQIK
mgnify:CR=1 FL=1